MGEIKNFEENFLNYGQIGWLSNILGSQNLNNLHGGVNVLQKGDMKNLTLINKKSFKKLCFKSTNY